MSSKLKVVLKIVVFALLVVYCFIQAKDGGDFRIFLGAAELLKEGKSCYNEWIHLSGDNYGQYSYSPFFAISLIPLSYLPNPLPSFIWELLNLLFLYRIYKILNFYLDLESLSKKQFILWSLITALLSLRFILHNLEMVQMNIFILYCCLESVYQLNKAKSINSGLILGIGIITKILPVILLPYFLYKRKYKTLLVSFLTTLLLLLFPMLIFGWEFNSQLITEWVEIINPNKEVYVAEQNKFGEGVHSLSGLFGAYFSTVDSKFNIEYPRLIYEFNSSQLFWILNLSRLFLILTVASIMRIVRIKLVQEPVNSFVEIAYILALVPLIFPHQQKYAFVFLLPIMAYLSLQIISTEQPKHFSKNKWIYLYVFVFFVLAVLTTDGVIGKRLNQYSMYFKTITVGTFFLLIGFYLSLKNLTQK